MIQDNHLAFARQQAITGTSDVVSTNVYDAGVAKRVFDGTTGGILSIQVTAIGGTNPTFRGRLVGADNEALTTNPIILADIGVSPVIAAADLPLLYEVRPRMQKVAKRYYGVIFTLGGTSPTATANAAIVADSQSNMVGAQ